MPMHTIGDLCLSILSGKVYQQRFEFVCLLVCTIGDSSMNVPSESSAQYFNITYTANSQVKMQKFF